MGRRLWMAAVSEVLDRPDCEIIRVPEGLGRIDLAVAGAGESGRTRWAPLVEVLKNQALIETIGERRR